jgi:uncharacterized protein YbcI
VPLLEISNAVVSLHKQKIGRGPTKAHTSIDGDVITCTLGGGLTRAETTLQQHGLGHEVHRLRDLIYEASRQEIVATIEALVGRRVRSFMATSDPDTDTHAWVFILQHETDERARAVEARVEAAHRSSQELYGEQRALVAQQQQLAAELGRRSRRRREETE